MIDFAEDGEMNNHEFYSTVDYYCDEDAIQSFTKKGRYFILFGCGHGSGYGSSYMYIFDKLLPEDSLNTVWDQIYSSTSLNFKGYSELLTSVVEVKNDSLLLHYQLNKGTYHKKATEWTPMEKADVCYIKENALWHATDSSFLNKISSLFY